MPQTAPSTVRVLLLTALVVATVLASAGVATALPELAADLRLGPAVSGWVLAAYSLGFAVATAVFGRLSDHRGLKVVVHWGLGLFAAGSLLAAAAGSSEWLLAGRLVQGVGGGSVPVLATVLITSLDDVSARRRALGSLTAVLTISSALGPLMGGVVADTIGWRSLLALPTGSVLLVSPLSRQLPIRSIVPGRFDGLGALLVVIATAGFLIVLQLPASGGRAAVGGVVGLLLLVSGVGGLVWRLRRGRDAFLPLALVKNRGFRGACAAGCSLFAAYYGLLYAVPLLLALTRGWSLSRIGIMLLPAAALGAVGSRVAGWSSPPRGFGPASICGLSAAGALVAAGPGWLWTLILGLGLASAALGSGHVVLLGVLPEQVAQEDRGIALGLFNLCFFVGGAVGAVLVGGFMERGLPRLALVALALLPIGGGTAYLACRERVPG